MAVRWPQTTHPLARLPRRRKITGLFFPGLPEGKLTSPRPVSGNAANSSTGGAGFLFPPAVAVRNSGSHTDLSRQFNTAGGFSLDDLSTTSVPLRLPSHMESP